jgi:hypothetical protein
MRRDDAADAASIRTNDVGSLRARYLTEAAVLKTCC